MSLVRLPMRLGALKCGLQWNTPVAATSKRYQHIFVGAQCVTPIKRMSIHLQRYVHSTRGRFQQTRPSGHKDQLKISSDKKKVFVANGDGFTDSFNATWLRYHCQCETCTHPDSGQKDIDPAERAPLYSIKQAHIQDGILVVACNEEDHTLRFPLTYLEQNSYAPEALKRMVQDRVPPPSDCKGTVPRVSYDTVASSERGLWEWVKHLNEEGICIVENVPRGTSVKEVVQKINQTQKTVYGDVFSTVSSSSDLVNLAYTSRKLTLHVDLPYYESPPGYQFLHCERFDECIEGGESVFVDAWYEAQRMQKLYPDEFATLTRVPASFFNVNYAQDRVDMRHREPHFTVDAASGQITNIKWTIGVQGPLCVAEEDIEPYYKAYHRFAGMLRDSESKIEFRLKEGELVSFCNRRFVHARNEIKPNGGQRIFKGVYINADEMKSRAQMLSNDFNGGKKVKFVFNRSAI